MSETSYPRTDGDDVDDTIALIAAAIMAELLDAKGGSDDKSDDSTSGSGGSGGGGGGRYTPADLAALDAFNHDTLVAPIAPGAAEPGAIPMTEPLHLQDHSVSDVPVGWDAPPQWVVDTFSETPHPIELPAGTSVYRFVGQSSDPEKFAESIVGSWWSLGVPKTEAEWHSDYAVKGEWNMDGGYVEVKLEHPVNVWMGGAAAQESSKPGLVLKGGAKQVWVQRGRIDPRDHGSTLRDSLHRSPWNSK